MSGKSKTKPEGKGGKSKPGAAETKTRTKPMLRSTSLSSVQSGSSSGASQPQVEEFMKAIENAPPIPKDIPPKPVPVKLPLPSLSAPTGLTSHPVIRVEDLPTHVATPRVEAMETTVNAVNGTVGQPSNPNAETETSQGNGAEVSADNESNNGSAKKKKKEKRKSKNGEPKDEVIFTKIYAWASPWKQ